MRSASTKPLPKVLFAIFATLSMVMVAVLGAILVPDPSPSPIDPVDPTVPSPSEPVGAYMLYEHFFDDVEPKFDIPEKALEITYTSLISEGKDAFRAMLEVPSKGDITGLAYSTDETYSSDDEYFIGCGFLSLEDVAFDRSAAYVITPIDEAHHVDGITYIWSETVSMEPSQFVCYDRYCVMTLEDSVLSVSAKTMGAGLFSSADDYKLALKEVHDPKLGALFNYDLDKFEVLPQKVYEPIRIDPMYKDIDYSDLTGSLEAIIEAQDINFSKEEVSTVYAESIALITAFLAETQGAINNIPMSEFERYAKDLSIDEVLTFDGTMINVVPLKDPPATELDKWMTGILCSFVAIAAVATMIALPGLGMGVGAMMISAVAGMAMGASIQVMDQVIVQGIAPANVNWSKVAICGVIGGLTGPFLGQLSGLLAGAVGGGLEVAILALMDGATLDAALLAGTIGLVAGLAVGTAFVVAPVILKSVTSKIFNKAPTVKGAVLKKMDTGNINPVKFKEFSKHSQNPFLEEASLKALIQRNTSGLTPRPGCVMTDVKHVDIIEIPGSTEVKVKFKGKATYDDGSTVKNPEFLVRNKGIAEDIQKAMDTGFTKVLVPTPTKVVIGPQAISDIILKNPKVDKSSEFCEHITFHQSGERHEHYRTKSFQYGLIENRHVKYDVNGNFISEYSLKKTNRVATVDGKDVPVFEETIMKADGTTSTKDVRPNFNLAVDGSYYMTWKDAKNVRPLSTNSNTAWAGSSITSSKQVGGYTITGWAYTTDVVFREGIIA